MTPIEKKPEELHPDSQRRLEDASGINKNPRRRGGMIDREEVGGV